MKEYLPQITVQEGFYFSDINNINPHKRFFSFNNTNKNIYQKFLNDNNTNHKKTNIVNANNFVIASNINKDEVKSFKNNTAIIYYNRGLYDKKNNQHIEINNIVPETFYNKNNTAKKNNIENILLNSNNNSIKMMKSFNNEINIVSKNNLRDAPLFLPEVQNDNKNKKVNKKISLRNKSNINMNNKNSLIKAKKELNIIKSKNNSKRNVFSHEKINYNIHPVKRKDTLAAIGFLDIKKNKIEILNDENKNNNFSNRKTISSGNKYDKNKEKDIKGENNNNINNRSLTVLFNNIKSIKSFYNIKNINMNYLNLNNNKTNSQINNNKIIIKNKISNKNTSNIKICPICHKEKEINKYSYHLSLHPSKILDWLYLGSYRNACDEQQIKDLGISYVLNCAIECKESFPPSVKYCHLKISDRPNFRIINYLDKASAFINQAKSNNGVILVHCMLGISRSTTCVISYFIKYLGFTATNALNFIKKKRTQIMPNFGFLNQLKIYEKNNIGVVNEKK